MADLRAWSSFDPKSQQIMLSGGTVTGGDGRQFVWLNGHATVVGSQTYNTLMARRAANRQAGAVSTAAPALPGGTDSPFKRPGAPGTTIPSGGSNPNLPYTSPMSGEVVGGPTSPIDTSDEGIDAADKARQNDARARILSVLAEYGLESLADFVWQQILAGKSDAEVLQDIRNTPEFKKRFPAIEERTKKGLAPISPGEYVAYERQARQLMRAAGLPESFYDTQDDFDRFLSNDVSITELNDRIQLGRQAAYDAPSEVRAALMRDYGVSEGGLTAFFLDPDKAQPLLEKQWKAAQIGGAAERTGFGRTSREQNERLALLGVTAGQAQEGFGVLGESRELFGALDAGEDTIDTDAQLGAAFAGDSNARRRIEERRRRRQATFEGGGGYAAGQGGISGLGRS